MAYRRRAAFKAPIHTEKHITQVTLATVATATHTDLTIAIAVAAPGTNSWEVHEGSHVKAVYLELWLTSDDATQGSIVGALEKRGGTAAAMTYAQSVALNSYPNKNNVFYITQGLTPPNVQSGIPFVRGWFTIPKGKQRLALGESLIFNLSGINNGANYCGYILFKEYQ